MLFVIGFEKRSIIGFGLQIVILILFNDPVSLSFVSKISYAVHYNNNYTHTDKELLTMIEMQSDLIYPSPIMKNLINVVSHCLVFLSRDSFVRVLLIKTLVLTQRLHNIRKLFRQYIT